MKIYAKLSLCIAVAIMALTACKSNDNSELAHHHHHDHEAHAHEGHNHGDEDHDHEGGNHEHEGHSHESHPEGTITLDPEVAARFGVHSTAAVKAPMQSAIKVGGVLEHSGSNTAVITAPIAGVVSLGRNITTGSAVSAGSTVATVKSGTVSGTGANDVARAELEATRAEYERLQPLYEQKLVTTTRFNEAKAAYERAKAAYSAGAASGAATSPIAGVITGLSVESGQFVEAGAQIATVATSSALSLRAQLPARYAMRAGTITDARVVDPTTGTSFTISSLGGSRLASSTAAAGGGYIPVMFTFNNTIGAVPGQAVEVYLLESGNGEPVITVPLSALYEQQGDYCVFVQLDEDCYLKTPVTIGADNGSDVVILSGIKEGDLVVDKGVTTVRLAGASGAVPAGHSHSH